MSPQGQMLMLSEEIEEFGLSSIHLFSRFLTLLSLLKHGLDREASMMRVVNTPTVSQKKLSAAILKLLRPVVFEWIRFILHTNSIAQGL